MMPRKLLFASTNLHKLEEIEKMLPPEYAIKSLSDIGWQADLPEPFETFEENAASKTSTLFEATGLACFAEDSGLEIDALGGRPGVYSARYAGLPGDSLKNINKVLDDLKNRLNRSARFISVIAYQTGENEIHYFKGTVEGEISERPYGAGGFGYDPIFIPNGFDQPFALLPSSLKNRISHRSKSIQQFITYLHHS